MHPVNGLILYSKNRCHLVKSNTYRRPFRMNTPDALVCIYFSRDPLSAAQFCQWNFWHHEVLLVFKTLFLWSNWHKLHIITRKCSKFILASKVYAENERIRLIYHTFLKIKLARIESQWQHRKTLAKYLIWYHRRVLRNHSRVKRHVRRLIYYYSTNRIYYSRSRVHQKSVIAKYNHLRRRSCRRYWNVNPILLNLHYWGMATAYIIYQ